METERTVAKEASFPAKGADGEHPSKNDTTTTGVSKESGTLGTVDKDDTDMDGTMTAATRVEKQDTAPTEATTTTGTTMHRSTAPTAATTISKPALVDLNEWDQRWEEQYERRKRRKVVPDTLPAHTIGRADDPIRLAAGPCTCSGPCHLNDLCPCNHIGLFCTEKCHCGKACENCYKYAESRHRALIQAIQQGHRPIVHECCPCAPVCEAATCPCAMLGQRCRHTAPFRSCQNPCGTELAVPLGNKRQQGPLSVCLRVTPPKKKPITSKVLEKKPSTANGSTRKGTLVNSTKTTESAGAAANTPGTATSKPSSATTSGTTSSKAGTKHAPKSHGGTTSTTPIVPTGIQKAWETADARADEYFANDRGAHELDALYDIAAHAQVHARSELQLNQAERWWWRDIIPSAASPGRKPKLNHAEDLECHEPYEGIQVERDINKPKLREAIIQVSEETLILRYAAMVLRQKARDLAEQRLKRKKPRGS